VTRRRALVPRAAQRPDWYRLGPVLALAGDGNDEATSSTADVYVFDMIGGWFGMTADDFVRDVAGLDVDELVVHLNSPGGDAAEGVAIANVLRAHRAHVIVRVDGMAASAASVIAMAGDEIVMGIGSTLMIHDAWGVCVGNAADMVTTQRGLDSMSNALASTYAARAGGTSEQWREVMRAETWYSADEAVTAGLADRVAATDEVGTAAGEQITPGSSLADLWSWWDSARDPDRFDLAAFAYAGRSAAPAPAMPGRQTPAANAAGDGTNREGGSAVAFSDEQLTTMRQRLGVADDADEQTILDALDEALDERADDTAGEPALARLPEGVVAIDRAQLEEMRTRAERGDQARAQQEREHRESLVDAAVRDGRIPVARRDAWLAQLQADPGAAETLASLQAGLVPVGREIGHSSGDAVADAGEQRMKNGAELYGRRHGKTA
jgi:ATP-dependent protease ClpP protease subunit